MGMKDVILTVVLVLFITSHVANADFLLNFRKLANEDLKLTAAPILSLVGGVGNGKVKNDHISPTSTPEENKSKEDQVKSISPAAKPPTDTKKPDSPVKDVKEHDIDTSNDKGKADNKSPKEELTEKEKGKTKGAESCDGVERRCQDDNSMIACMKSFDDVSKVVVLLIQNKGENSLKVDLTSSSSGIEQEAIEIPKLQTEQVNIPLAKVGGNEIKLNAGNGFCVLHLNLGAPTFQGNYFQWVPPYSRFMTPIYGAYLVLSITLIAVGVCACCWFCKRKRTSDIPYQELEMSVPESAADVDTAEGWDDNWDDDWDEEKAVKSPGHNISGNGLTARTPKKDGWEDWDD